ncbi:hypothetical protein ACN2EN_02750 [Aliarcobacter lanthieri]|uniref:hypothetical protein n=1 Tax=Aliarcobacter lanthieri TaxID=1355374 RepID=UPI00047C9FBC|nr:hypothetical protein [Aliarcobacter lanthieri]QKF58579.1 putative membrane protein [Aliarcobacter lanthieri]
MTEKRFRSLWETTKKKCCIKKFLELENVAKYGSISILVIAIFSQVYNLIISKDFNLSLISLLINIFFLIIVLIKLNIIKLFIKKDFINYSLIFLIFILLLNFFMYLFVDSWLYQYVYAPINLIGAYFIFLLLKKDSII